MLDRTAHTVSAQILVADRLQRLSLDLFAALREASFDGVGVSRETYGSSETEAMEIVASVAASEGLGVEWDPARNLIISLPGSKRMVQRAVLFRIAGAVPRWPRHDAVLAMADLLVRLDEHWRVLLEWGEDLVLTSGIVETDPNEHALSRVPGEVTFALEYPSQDMKTLQSFGKLIESGCAQVASRRGVRLDYDVFRSDPTLASLAKLHHVIDHMAMSGALDERALADLRDFAADAPQWSCRHGGIVALPAAN